MEKKKAAKITVEAFPDGVSWIATVRLLDDDDKEIAKQYLEGVQGRDWEEAVDSVLNQIVMQLN